MQNAPQPSLARRLRDPGGLDSRRDAGLEDGQFSASETLALVRRQVRNGVQAVAITRHAVPP